MSKKKNARSEPLTLVPPLRAPTAETRPTEDKKMVELKRNARRDLDAFIDSSEGRAREALRLRLEALRIDPEISKSDTCIEVLSAFIHCVTYGWGARDSDAMMRVLGPQYARRQAVHAANEKHENDPAQAAKVEIREKWVAWQNNPGQYRSKAAFARAMLNKFAGVLKSPPVIERWCRVWEQETPAKK
jgi:hypothetical protein